MKKFPKKAAIVSEILIIVWFVIQISLGWLPRFWSNIFGTSMYNGIYIIHTGYADITALYMVYAMLLAAAVLTAANVMIFRDKGKRAPIVISSVTTILLPAASKLLTLFQESTLRHIYGEEIIIGTKGTVIVSFVFYAGAVFSISAAAVYLFQGAKRTSPEENKYNRDFE